MRPKDLCIHLLYKKCMDPSRRPGWQGPFFVLFPLCPLRLRGEVVSKIRQAAWESEATTVEFPQKERHISQNAFPHHEP